MEILQMPTNAAIADALEALANRLEEQDANPYRVQAYLNAAQSVRAYEIPLAELVERGGPDALTALSGVGERLASRITGFIRTGRLELLETLNEQITPKWLFKRVVGIGDEMAQRIVDELKLETLEELETAAYDGRLASLEGFGRGRIQTVRAQLDHMMRRSARRRVREREQMTLFGRAPHRTGQPSVALLLALDREYRQKAERDELFKITPRRFNPEGKAWLPILRTWRQHWNFTILFSNTARAHELNKTDDWVVLFYEHGGMESQCTIVTETRGRLKDRRVVRGRETECERFYESLYTQAA